MLTIELIQQTPMWHFQSDVCGGCLRATEVKPKLDRFLIGKYGNDDHRLHFNTPTSLDYKLVFEPVCNQSLSLEFEREEMDRRGRPRTRNLYPIFFANMGEEDRSKKKNLVFFKQPIRMKVFSLFDDMLEIIQKCSCEFFATHSFGTRQDKGFGFFFPKDGKYFKPYGADFKLSFSLTGRNDNDQFQEIFNYINSFHKWIRSGLNFGTTYYKSLMYFYVDEVLEKKWDKPYIRHYFEFDHPNYKNGSRHLTQNRCELGDRHAIQEVELYRDALGLASDQMWLKYDDTIHVGFADDKDKTRFKSPILYRPNRYARNNRTFCDVYIHLDDSDLERLKNEDLLITNSESHRQLSAHIAEDFDLFDYFDFIADNYEDIRDEIEGRPDRFISRLRFTRIEQPNSF